MCMSLMFRLCVCNIKCITLTTQVPVPCEGTINCNYTIYLPNKEAYVKLLFSKKTYLTVIRH